jgi:hypothetical protein
MKKGPATYLFAFLLTAAVFLPGIGWGQITFTATYNLSGDGNDVVSFSYNGTTYEGIIPGDLEKVGVISTSSNGNFRGDDWPLGATSESDVFSGSFDPVKYIGFTIEATPGYKFTVTSITFGIGRSGTGPRQWQWRGSADEFESPIDNYSALNPNLTNNHGIVTNPDLNSSWTGNNLSLGANYENIIGEVGFRLFGFNAEAVGGTGGLHGNISINGTFEEIINGQDLLANYNFEDILYASNTYPGLIFDDVSISSGSISFQNGTDAGGLRIGYSTTWNQEDFSNLGKHLEFCITPENGYQVLLSTLNFRFGRTYEGPTKITIHYSLDDFFSEGFPLIENAEITSTDVNNLNTISISGTTLPTEPVFSRITFRIWGHNATGTGNLRFNNFRIFGVVSERPPCNPVGLYFRTRKSGFWNNAFTWEASTSNDIDSDWLVEGCIPTIGSEQVIIKPGNLVVLKEPLSINQLLVKGTLDVKAGGALTIVESVEIELTIESGGLLHFNGGIAPKFEGDASIIVQTGGIIKVTTNVSGISSALAANGSINRVFFETDAVFEWDNSSSFQTSGQIYFPNDLDKIPVFRTLKNVNISSSDYNPTIINGVFESNGQTIWNNPVEKTFRNGIRGSGNIIQGSNSGPFIINGTNAQLGGSGLLNLNNNGLIISGEVDLISDKTITGGPVTLSAALNGNNNRLNLGGDFLVTETGSLPDASAFLVFNGTVNQNINVADDKILDHVKINKAGGDLFLQTPLYVSQSLAMTHGNIKTNEHLLTIGISATQTGELNYSAGTIFGKLRRYFSTDTPTSGVLFPIGASIVTDIENNVYTPHHLPVLIDYPSVKPITGGSLTAWFVPGSMGEAPDNLIVPETDNCGAFHISSVSYQGFWRFLAEGLSGGEYDITLSPNGYIGIYDLCQLTALKRTGNGPWTESGTHVKPTGTITQPVIKRTGVTSGFSDWGIGGGIDNPLPIDLLSFTAKYQDGIVLLNWATGSEINNDYFTLERSRDAVSAEIIGFVDGAGNSSQTLPYEFVDHDPLPGISYYRLKQTDYDGSFEYSLWVAVQVDGIGGRLQALAISQPQGLMLRIYSPTERPLQVQLADIYGRIVHSQELSPGSPGQIETFVPMPQSARSVLLYRITDGLDVVTGKVIR